jgi:Flp pilus assembly protein TadD
VHVKEALRRLSCCVGVALAGAIVAWAQSPPAPRVLIMPFTVTAGAEANAATSYWLGEAAMIVLSDELAALGVGVFTRAERIAAFDRLHLPRTATLTRATIIRAGEVLGAQAVIVGDVQLSARLAVRAATIRLDAAHQLPEMSDAAAPGELFALFERLARVAAGQLGADVPATPRDHVHPPLDAFESYVKGLVATTLPVQEKFLVAAVHAAPAYDNARLALWGVQEAEGQSIKALVTARALAVTSPQYRTARYAAALSLIDLKRYDEASAQLEALHAERASGAVSNALGVIAIRRGQPDTAVLSRAAAEAPGNLDVLFNLGYACALSADTTGALRWLRESVRREPADGDAHVVLSAVLASTGQTAEAQRELDLAKSLGAPHVQATSVLTDHVPRGLERLRPELE